MPGPGDGVKGTAAVLFIAESPEPVQTFLRATSATFQRIGEVVGVDRLLTMNPSGRALLVFCGIDTLSEEMQRSLVRWVDSLGSRPRILNLPYVGASRYSVQQRLFRGGHTEHRVHRHPLRCSSLRFPVFLRDDKVHGPPLSNLIASAAGLREAVHRCRRPKGARRLIAVEFVESKGEDGLYHKFSAFVVDGAIIPAHLYVSSHWCVKSANRVLNKRALKLEAAYVSDNPHCEELSRMCKDCDIGFARLDYLVANERIHVCDVNFNPLIVRSAKRVLLDQRETRYVQLLEQAFLAAGSRYGQ